MPLVQDKQARKDKVWSNVQTCCNKYTKCVFVNVDNVTSKQICVMRKALRDIDAQMVMGKNVSRHSKRNYYLDPYESRHFGTPK